MIKTACSGFPVGRKIYESKLKAVELKQLFDAAPRPATIEKWKDGAAKDFEFIVCASKSITHPHRALAQHAQHGGHHNKSGYFQETAHVKNATQATLSAAHTLNAKIILFSLPSQFTPHPDNVARAQRYLHAVHRGNAHLVWEPPTTWPKTLVESLSRQLRMAAAFNPLNRHWKGMDGPFRYFRLGKDGKTSGLHKFTDAELREVRAACDKPLSYVIFNNGPESFADAVRFSSLS